MGQIKVFTPSLHPSMSCERKLITVSNGVNWPLEIRGIKIT